ncbi:MAG: 2-amino-4-hydroxy-6-hydroxymethyldihydropteridine diphosphokinase [Acidimicrobiia bacterium]|nr:2-amino-4-hydroxy-6-hydroxymethyldihydropteridine diphosphokinase [Acidimicrobiia bacterium]
MTRAAIALGSNLGDRLENLEFAVEALGSLGELVGVSDLYETAPVGGPEQGAYLNAVAILETGMAARNLLAALHDVEHLRGRTRSFRWEARTLDLDLLLYGMETHSDEACTIPHPRLLERRFVIEPLLNVWPDAVLPDGTGVATYAAAVEDQEVTGLGAWWSLVPPSKGFHGRGGWWVVAQVVMILAVVLALGAGGPSLPGGDALSLAGIAVIAAGVIESALGLFQLGERLTPFPEPLDGGGMVHGGVYAAVRHPIYGGIVVALVGAALFKLSVVGLGAGVMAGVFFWWKASKEEARLLRRFPQYADYRARTKARLIPWVI